eukprot:jgi/Bigna1/77864/fgenesh1_pg.51_\
MMHVPWSLSLLFLASVGLASYPTMNLPAIPEGMENALTDEQPHASYPESYEFTEEHPECVLGVRDQGRCGSCWAFAATGSLADRKCVITGKPTRLSPQDLLDCEKLNLGCKMGSLPDMAWTFLRKHGVADDTCVPYESGRTSKSDKCSKKCELSYLAKNVTLATGVKHYKGEAAIMAAVAEGPVDVTFNVYTDFEVHWEKRTNETYVKTDKSILKFTGIHSVKVVGYGVDDKGIKYWTIENSWGESGGFGGKNNRGGYIRVRRGTNECGIERLVYAGWPVVQADLLG